MRHRVFKTFCGILGGVFLLTVAAFAQDAKPGKLKITVSPKQAYTFIDGKAIGPGNRTIRLDVGTHHLVVANYGFKFVEQDVSIDPDHTLPLDIKLEPAGAEVPGPRGRIQVEVGMRRRHLEWKASHQGLAARIERPWRRRRTLPSRSGQRHDCRRPGQRDVNGQSAKYQLQPEYSVGLDLQ